LALYFVDAIELRYQFVISLSLSCNLKKFLYLFSNNLAFRVCDSLSLFMQM
jgi:hypothetical protein